MMVDVQPTNEKLVDRACRIISATVDIDTKKALQFLEKANKNVAQAIVMAKTGKTEHEAAALLKKYHGNIRSVLDHE